MDVSSVNSTEEIQRLLQAQQASQGQNAEMPPPPEGFPGDKVSMSQIGSLFQDMSESGKAEMEGFRDELIESLKNGTFDASALAASAPEELKQLAEEQGIDLESALQEDATMFEELRAKFGSAPPGPPPEPPQESENTSSQSDEESDETSSLLTDENENGIPDIMEES